MRKIFQMIRQAMAGKGFEEEIRAEALFLLNVFTIGGFFIISVIPVLFPISYWAPDSTSVLAGRFSAVLLSCAGMVLLFNGNLRASMALSVASVSLEAVVFTLMGNDSGVHGTFRMYFSASIVVILAVIYFRRLSSVILSEILSFAAILGAWIFSYRHELGTHPFSDPALFSVTRVFFFMFFISLAMYVMRTVFDGIIRKMNESRIYLEELAFQDSLTGLPNANRVRTILDGQIEKVRANREGVMLVGVDIKNFSKINRNYGYETGDLILKLTGARMAALFADISAGRLTGSTFLGIAKALPEGGEEENSFLERIAAALSFPVNYRGNIHLLQMQIALTYYPQDGDTGGQLVSNIMNLLYAHRDKNVAEFIRYNQAQYAELRKKIRIEECVPDALDRDEFYFVYQPKFFLEGGKLSGFESLARWRHAELGFISPADFIPAVEQGAYLERFTELCIERAERDRKEFSPLIPEEARIAVNISSILFQRNWVDRYLIQGVQSGKIDPRHFELEITESIFVGSDQEVIQKINSLVDHGFSLAIDDFGTGYSNLRYLQRFRVQHLKIDKEFVTLMHSNEENREIVRVLIQMAHVLGIRTIAEGVEYAEQAEMLSKLGCDQVQGYLFGRPMEVPALMDFLGKKPGG